MRDDVIMADKVDHQLTEAEAALLLAATQDAMAAAGGLGGGIGAGRAGAAGGSRGGRFGAKLTKPSTSVATVVTAQHADVVRAAVHQAIGEHGTVIPDPNQAGDGSIWGIVASGAMNMVPALVRVDVEPAADGAATQVRVRATGREGLIKQKIAGKAVDRIAGRIGTG